MRYLCCSIFKEEIEELRKEGLFDGEVEYLTSMLHLYPKKLDIVLIKELAKNTDEDTVLVYGDCCPTMLDFTTKDHTSRTKGRNCCELLLGTEEFRKHLKAGAFFLMPEWVIRWREIFEEFLELNRDVAQDMMTHLHKYFLYVDSGRQEEPTKLLDEISEYFTLPWKSIKIDLSTHFLKALRNSAIREDTPK